MSIRKSTPRGQMTSSGGGPAVTMLPPQMRVLFEARTSLPFLAPMSKKKCRGFGSMASCTDKFETELPPAREPFVDPREVKVAERVKIKQEKLENLNNLVSSYDPRQNNDAKGDGYKTLFVARLPYDVTEKRLRHEFDQYGNIVSICMVANSETRRPRGYAFLEFETEAAMRQAYQSSNGKSIDGRKILVDVERGRTVTGWLPKRLGGGLSTSRQTKSKPISTPAAANSSSTSRSSSFNQYGPATSAVVSTSSSTYRDPQSSSSSSSSRNSSYGSYNQRDSKYDDRNRYQPRSDSRREYNDRDYDIIKRSDNRQQHGNGNDDDKKTKRHYDDDKDKDHRSSYRNTQERSRSRRRTRRSKSKSHDKQTSSTRRRRSRNDDNRH